MDVDAEVYGRHAAESISASGRRFVTVYELLCRLELERLTALLPTTTGDTE